MVRKKWKKQNRFEHEEQNVMETQYAAALVVNGNGWLILSSYSDTSLQSIPKET